MSCDVGRRLGSDPGLPWLQCRPAAAALIQLLAWELPYVAYVALIKKKKERNELFNVEKIIKLILISLGMKSKSWT